MEEYSALIDAAKEASKHSYSPYSDFAVGAALLTADGKIYQGANIENASYGATICAERVAITKAVYEGAREFRAIAIYANAKVPPYPCGICLQVMSEFCGDIPVLLATEESRVSYLLSELLPHPFDDKFQSR